MKFNWGTGIALVYGIFVVAMLTLVIRSTRYDPGLVQKDYYKLDLNYQEHFDKKQNTANLAQKPEAAFDTRTQKVVIRFPEGMAVQTGSAKFMRASAVNTDDFHVALSGGLTEVPAETLHKGRWHIELDWVADSRPYFMETTITL